MVLKLLGQVSLPHGRDRIGSYSSGASWRGTQQPASQWEPESTAQGQALRAPADWLRLPGTRAWAPEDDFTSVCPWSPAHPASWPASSPGP